MTPLPSEVSTKLRIVLESYTFGPVRRLRQGDPCWVTQKLTGSPSSQWCPAVSTAKPVLRDAPGTAWFDTRLIILSTLSQVTKPRTPEKIKPVWTVRTKTKQLTFL